MEPTRVRITCQIIDQVPTDQVTRPAEVAKLNQAASPAGTRPGRAWGNRVGELFNDFPAESWRFIGVRLRSRLTLETLSTNIVGEQES